MKNLILPVLVVSGLLAMSFNSISSHKVGVVKNSSKVVLTNIDQISLKDLKELNDMTTRGMKTTTVVNQSVYADIYDQTLYKTTDGVVNVKQAKKLNEILLKY